MAEANAAALIKAQKREKMLKILARRKAFLPVRRGLLFVGLIASGIAVWHWVTGGDFWGAPTLWVAIVAFGVWSFIPSRKNVEKLEDAIESDIKNGFY